MKSTGRDHIQDVAGEKKEAIEADPGITGASRATVRSNGGLDCFD